MTINRIIYVVLLLVLVAFFVLYVDKLSLIVLVFAILLPIVSLVTSIIARKSLVFKFDVKSKSIPKDTPIKLDVRVTNKSIFPVANVVLMFEYYNSLDGKVHKMTITMPSAQKDSNTVSFNINSKYCGIVNVKLFQTKIYDNFKLFCLRKRHQQECSILIMPKFHDIPMEVENLYNEVLESDVFSKVKAGDDSSEVFDIREYQEGDRLNRIHWKLSSKNEETYVKEYSLPISNSIVIIPEIVNHDGLNISTMDTITELLLSISQKLNENEVDHRICICNAENASIESVYSNEETLTIVGSIVRNGVPKMYSPYAFNYFQAINDYPSYSHTIYITNVLDVNVLSSLEDFNSTKKTVFYVSNNTLPKNLLAYDGIQITQVVESKILECISEFIL